MQQLEFKDVKNKLKNFKFNSLEYYGYEQVENYEIAINTENVIIAIGYNKEYEIKEFHWAANNWPDITEIVQSESESVLVTFIPEEWKERFIKAGFKEYAVYREYWIEDIQKSNFQVCSYSVLNESEICAASKVTRSCQGQSRGFHGESPEWVESWMNGTEDGLSNATDSTILASRENNEVNGIVCVAIYGHERKNGPILWIREIAVRPEEQGQGIGRKLLEQALSYGIEHGAKRAFLMADECNMNAKQLYQDIGFTPSVDEVQIDMVYEGRL